MKYFAAASKLSPPPTAVPPPPKTKPGKKHHHHPAAPAPAPVDEEAINLLDNIQQAITSENNSHCVMRTGQPVGRNGPGRNRPVPFHQSTPDCECCCLCGVAILNLTNKYIGVAAGAGGRLYRDNRGWHHGALDVRPVWPVQVLIV